MGDGECECECVCVDSVCFCVECRKFVIRIWFKVLYI